MTDMRDQRLKRLEKETERIYIEKQALNEWILPIFPVETAGFMWIQDHFRLTVKCEYDLLRTVQEGHPDYYKEPSKSYAVDPFLLRDKLVNIFGEPIPAWLGRDGITVSVYADTELERLTKKDSRMNFQAIDPFYIQSHIYNDIEGGTTVNKFVRLFDCELRWYVNSPVLKPDSNGFTPMMITISGSADLFGVEGYREAVRYDHSKKRDIYGKAKMRITEREGVDPWEEVHYHGGMDLYYHWA